MNFGHFIWIGLLFQCVHLKHIHNQGFDIREKLIFCCSEEDDDLISSTPEPKATDPPLDDPKINETSIYPPVLKKKLISRSGKPTERGKITKKKCEEYTECDLEYPEYTIVGGVPVANGELPYMGAVGWPLADKKGYYAFNCGGSLISENFVLTAAHCSQIFEDKTLASETPTIVRFSEVELYKEDSDVRQDADIHEIYIHPEYQVPRKYHDIALLKLKAPVKLSMILRPACLWQSAPADNLTELIATGWGRTKYGGNASDYLMKIDISVTSTERCNKQYSSSRRLPQGIINGQLCAGDFPGVQDTCQGDSGGPLVIVDPVNFCAFHQVGITSFGIGCATSAPGVYTRVEEYLDWIEPYVWPEEM